MLATIALVILVIVVRVAFKRLFKKSGTADTHTRCPCGYVLDHLPMARCPECGRVVGFNATAEELGLNDEELEQVRITQARRKSLTQD